MLPLPSRAPSSIAPSPAPLINSITPTIVPAETLADVWVHVIGQNFVSGDVVRVGGTGYTTNFVSSVKLCALVPAAVFASPTSLSVTVFRPPGGPSSNALTITVQWPVPTITTVNPNTVQQGSEDTTITITGDNYRSVSVVTFGAVTISSSLVDQQTISAVIPQVQLETGRTVPIAVVNPTPGGGISNSFSFLVGTNPPPPVPTLTGLAPSSVQAGSGNLPVTVTGTNFINPTTLVFGGNSISTTFINTTSLTANISSTLLTTAGSITVTVTNANGTSNSVFFTVTAAPPAPHLSSVSPSSVAEGSGNTAITLTGSGFVNPTTAFFDATSLATVFVNSTSLTATIPSALLATNGTGSITVTNANGTSNALTFTITVAPPPPVVPSIATVTPSSVQAGSGNTGITVAGANFINPTTVVFGVTSLVTVFVNGTTLTATIPSGSLVSSGSVSITATNTNGTSNAVTFTITAAPPAPSISSISPLSAQAGAGNTALSVTGLNFINPSTVKFGATSLSTTFISGTNLNATIPASLLTNQGTVSVTVTNANGTSNGITFTITQPPPPPPSFPTPAFQTPPFGAGHLPGMDTVSYPVGNVPVNANAPRWSEGNFRVADNGDVVVIFGDKFTSDTNFLASGRNGAVLQGVLVGSIDVANQMARVVLPSNLPVNDMYMVWPQNSIGVGEPFVVGRAEARWINTFTRGDNQVVVGDVVNVHGINLSNRAAAKCWVFLYNVAQQDGVYVDSTGANLTVANDRVQFTMPNLPTGTYDVWVHNGHGDQYGWSKCADQLIVTTLAALNLNYTNLNVNLAAPTGGAADDLAKFTAALTTIGNGGPATITCTAGTYLLSAKLSFVGGFGRPIKIKGQGVDVTIIKPHASFTDVTLLHGFAYGQLEDLTVDTTGFAFSQSPLRSCRLKNVKLICPASGANTIDLTENHPAGLITDSTITGTGIFSNGGPGALVDNVDFLETDNGENAPAVFVWNTSRWSVTNCTCQDLVINGTTAQRGNGKFVDFNFNCYYMHVADNTTTSLSPLDADDNANSGEQVNFEGELEGEGGITVLRNAANSSGAVVTFPSVTGINVVATLFVIGGKGTGQWGRVASIDAGANTVTLDRSLRVALDGTSQCAIRTGATECVVSRNTLDGNSQNGTASVGIEFFNSSAANVCDSNTITKTRYGLANEFKYALHNLFSNSTITDTQTCAANSAMIIGSIYRNLTGTQQSQADWITFSGPFIGTTFDTCSFTDAPKGLYDLGNGGSGNIALYQTTFSLGTGTFAGSIAEDFSGFTLTMVSSSFSGFQSNGPAGPPIDSLSIYPASVVLGPNNFQGFTPAGFNGSSQVLGLTYTWSVLSGGGSINANGVYTAPPSGSAVVQVTCGPFTVTANVTVSTAFAEGINFDTGTGVLTLKGTSFNDGAGVTIQNINGTDFALVQFQAKDDANNIVLSQSQFILLSSITQINFYGQSGKTENFTNSTAIPSVAFGGQGECTFRGGSGVDEFYSGIGANNTLIGFGGNDTLVGGRGNNFIYGGSGSNLVIAGPGPGINNLFPTQDPPF